MLILTRKIGEILKISDDVDVVVLGIKGSQARLGITALKEISVLREEILQKIQDEKSQNNERCRLKGNISESMPADYSLIDDLTLEHALLGGTEAEFNLGNRFYFQGQVRSARILLERAANKGHQQALELLKKIEEESRR